ncbi:MAG: hypothetical protein K1X64_15175 [Myxococcaceae bacterium]|nr:hypothetical protein [Myxococcaceae bacterium]
METELIAEINKATKHLKMDRSKLVRAAIRRYLVSSQTEEWEQNDIAAYRRKPLASGELAAWQKVRVWPEE